MNEPDRCRFCRLYAWLIVGFAALVGAVTAAQAGFGLRRFGGVEYVMRLVALSSVRSLGPGVSGSALLVAFVVWAHPLSVAELQAELPRVSRRALVVALPGYGVAVLIACLAGWLVGVGGFGQSWASLGNGFGLLRGSDAGAGFLSAAVDAGLVVFLARRYLARLQAGRSSLPAKLVLAWTFGTGLRLSAGLLVSMLVSG